MNTTVEAPIAPEIEVSTVSEEEGRRREILLRAAELIEQKGWITGSQGMLPDGPFCLMGAVAHVMGATLKETILCSPGAYGKFFAYRYDEASALIGDGGRGNDIDERAWRWNDKQKFRPDGKQRVLNALRRMANGATWAEVSEEEK